MTNGRPWSSEEIERLRQTIGEQGNTLALSLDLGRTHDALIAKAKRLRLEFSQSRRPMAALVRHDHVPALHADAPMALLP